MKKSENLPTHKIKSELRLAILPALICVPAHLPVVLHHYYPRNVIRYRDYRWRNSGLSHRTPSFREKTPAKTSVTREGGGSGSASNRP
jgi:hypothetical protein